MGCKLGCIILSATVFGGGPRRWNFPPCRHMKTQETPPSRVYFCRISVCSSSLIRVFFIAIVTSGHVCPIFFHMILISTYALYAYAFVSPSSLRQPDTMWCFPSSLLFVVGASVMYLCILNRSILQNVQHPISWFSLDVTLNSTTRYSRRPTAIIYLLLHEHYDDIRSGAGVTFPGPHLCRSSCGSRQWHSTRTHKAHMSLTPGHQTERIGRAPHFSSSAPIPSP